MKAILEHQGVVLKALKNKAAPFYLAGGTALARFYFEHRDSYDLDFFSRKYSTAKVHDLVQMIEKATGRRMKLIGENRRKDFVRLLIYELPIGGRQALKIDFVEDGTPLLKPLKCVDGIDILSLDDIYIRKIQAACGTLPVLGKTGQKHFLGGRQEAKDFFDLYHLSSTHQPLSSFAMARCDDMQREAVVRWYHTYSRSEIKIGLMELRTRHSVDFVRMERHFKQEIDHLIGGIV